MSNLEVALRRDFNEAQGERAFALASSNLAAYLGRLGRFADAQKLLEEVPASARWASAEITTSLMFAEAMVMLRDDYDTSAYERLWRGHAIATAARLAGSATQFSSWLFHFDFNRSDLVGMGRWLKECEDLSSEVHDQARTRLGLTFAAVCAYCGDTMGSDAWYRRVRSLASSQGDAAFLSASMYNRPAFGIAAARLEMATEGRSSADVSQLILEIESASNYSLAAGIQSSLSLQTLWRARAEMLRGNYNVAAESLGTAIAELPEANHPGRRLSMDLDLAICLNALRENAPEALSPGALASRDYSELEPDDMLVAMWQLQELDQDDVLGPSASSQLASLRDAYRDRVEAFERLVPRFEAFA